MQGYRIDHMPQHSRPLHRYQIHDSQPLSQLTCKRWRPGNSNCEQWDWGHVCHHCNPCSWCPFTSAEIVGGEYLVQIKRLHTLPFVIPTLFTPPRLLLLSPSYLILPHLFPPFQIARTLFHLPTLTLLPSPSPHHQESQEHDQQRDSPTSHTQQAWNVIHHPKSPPVQQEKGYDTASWRRDQAHIYLFPSAFPTVIDFNYSRRLNQLDVARREEKEKY